MAGVPVTGKCKAGHVTTETAPPGRVTWSGKCAAEGCGLPVTARRIPRNTDTPPPAATHTAGNYIRLDSYADIPDHPGDTGITVDPGAGDDDLGAGDQGETDPEVDDDPINDDEPGGKRRGLFRRSDRAGRPDRYRYGHPLY